MHCTVQNYILFTLIELLIGITSTESELYQASTVQWIKETSFSYGHQQQPHICPYLISVINRP